MDNAQAEQAIIERQIREIEKATQLREQQQQQNAANPELAVNDMAYLQQQFGGDMQGADQDAALAAQLQAREIA